MGSVAQVAIDRFCIDAIEFNGVGELVNTITKSNNTIQRQRVRTGSTDHKKNEETEGASRTDYSFFLHDFAIIWYGGLCVFARFAQRER